MKRRHFLMGGAAVAFTGAAAIVGVSSRMSEASASTEAAAGNTFKKYQDRLPQSTQCAPAPQTSLAEGLIKTIRTALDQAGLLNVRPDIHDFYNDIYAQYQAAFSNIADYMDEIDDAGMILDDPACYTDTPPEEGCKYSEAWKFYRHLTALKLYPADGSVSFDALTADQKRLVSTGTTAYAGMLQGLFGSLTAYKGLDAALSQPVSALYALEESLVQPVSAAPCLPQEQPRRQKPLPGIIMTA